MNFTTKSFLFVLLVGLFASIKPGEASAQLDALMPVPAKVEIGKGKYALDSNFTVYLRRIAHTRVDQGIERFLWRLDGRTGLRIAKKATDLRWPGNGLNIAVQRRGKLEVGEDEAYSLKVMPTRIMLQAETDLGIMHGLETLLQLLDADTSGYFFPVCTIEDQPRFPWRGLLIDACRHFMPVEMVKRNLDGMSAMKMNVLHWHLSEDQGFRVESKMFPKLHELGSNGQYYTQTQIKEIIAYADDRGIRVMPEFDIPGHATAWFVGHPELASAPGPYEVEKKFGIMKPVMDPTKESTYKLLEGFLGEMCNLFPDAYFHIGGDEVNPVQWENNPDIQAFMQENKIKDLHDLQQYFNEKILAMLTENGKRMIGWDEIMNKKLPKNAMIQSWRGKEGMKKAALEGYDVILSNGYYIDLCKPAHQHYANDPLPEEFDLPEKAAAHILGGEATMWAELVTNETVDSRIWPRTCAIAERLWSPGEVKDPKDMYRRLDKVSLRLEEVGLLHLRNPEMMMRRVCQGENPDALRTLLSVIEPLKIYNRHHQGIKYSTDLPLTRLPDMAVPDAKTAREFNDIVKEYTSEPDELKKLVLEGWLRIWESNHGSLVELSEKVPQLKDAVPLSAKLKEVSTIGLELLQMKPGDRINFAKFDTWSKALEKAKEPDFECELMVVDGVQLLMDWLKG